MIWQNCRDDLRQMCKTKLVLSEALQVFTHRLAQLAPAPLTPSSHAAPAAPAAQRRREGLRMLQPGDKPEVGSILIAHPMSCIFQPDLDRAVIVIDEVHPGHVRGLVLNKPGGILMETLKPEELERAKEAGLSGLLHNRLYLGGDLMDAEDLVNHVRWLHSSDLPGAQRLAPGLHCGGEGLAQLGAARPVLGFAGWHQDQLDLELERGVWVHLRAHSAVGLLPNDGDAETLWNDLAEAVGLSSFSSFPRGPEVDQLIKQHLDEHSRWQIESILEQAREENHAHGCASGFACRDFYDLLAPLLLQRMPEIHPICGETEVGGCVYLMWSFCKPRVMCQDLFDAVAARVIPEVQSLDRCGLAMFSWNYSYINYELKEVYKVSAAEALRTERLEELTPRDLANLMGAFAKAGIRDLDLMQALSEHGCGLLRDGIDQKCYKRPMKSLAREIYEEDFSAVDGQVVSLSEMCETQLGSFADQQFLHRDFLELADEYMMKGFDQPKRDVETFLRFPQARPCQPLLDFHSAYGISMDL
ncbi:unnamed protein product [Cladocopium goreaui]|uniref:ATP-dependent RNA helicase n=1 Tax=Cladocopium goreaui TaxID=2562237 RepID=A0A9P1DBT9_9DINO|nr:unnamed protein product [Cladocopium goreaui]